MRTATKGNQEDEEYEEDEFGSKKDGPSSNNPNNKGISFTKHQPFCLFFTWIHADPNVRDFFVHGIYEVFYNSCTAYLKVMYRANSFRKD